MSFNLNKPESSPDAAAQRYLATRAGEVTGSVSAAGKIVQVLFEGAKSPQDTILRTPLHVCVNKDCCQPSVWRSAAIHPLGDGTKVVSVDLRCLNCDTRYSRVCNPSDVHALDDRILEAQADLEKTIAVITQENMAVDVGNLILGLRLDLIGPDDFATPRTSWVDMQPPIN